LAFGCFAAVAVLVPFAAAVFVVFFAMVVVLCVLASGDRDDPRDGHSSYLDGRHTSTRLREESGGSLKLTAGLHRVKLRRWFTDR